MSLQETVDRLEREHIEYVVTELEPVDGSKNEGLSHELPTHVVQYFNKTGDDIVVLCCGNQSKVVCLSGYFTTPIRMRDAF
jgi:hypothetical protein